MGSYINQIDGKQLGTSSTKKCYALIVAGAVPIVQPTEFQENLVCVVDNGWMAAAGYAYSEEEFKAFLPTERDDRPREWFVFDRVKEFAQPKYWEDETGN